LATPPTPDPADTRRDDVDLAFAATAPPGNARARVRLPASLASWGQVVAIVLLLGASSFVAFDLERAGAVSFWAYAIVPTVVIAVAAVIRAARDGELADLRPEWGDATRGILSAAVLLGGAVAAMRVLAPAGSPRESWTARIYLQLGDPGWLRAHTGLVALMLLLAAAAEEIVWRGLVTRLIAEQVGSRVAWVWAAIPYALALSPTAWALRDPEAGLNPLLIVAGLGLGLVWGAMARFTRRLTPSILSHAAFDWCVIMLFRLWGSGV
jgi:membrane protease YdiL (CAAX protease family)